jgi:hypothetical protein
MHNLSNKTTLTFRLSYDNYTNLKKNHKPRQAPIEQTKQPSTHITPPTDIVYVQ